MKYTHNLNTRHLFSLIPLVAFISACGGGGGSGGATTSAATQVVSLDGAVADGYLQGATVCLDLNRNGSCDEGEPSTLSGVNGAYSLTRPEGAESAPIVAEVPATAIDEDTNQPLGKEVVFSAPAEKPGFVSPITTMIVDAMAENGLLDIEAAEAEIAGQLGISDTGSISLFDDYVDQGKQGNTDYQFIHQTARVVTAVMHEIRQEINTQAKAEGIDTTNNQDSQRRAMSLLRQEVRKALPTVVNQVVDAIAQGATPESIDVENLAGGISNQVKEEIKHTITERLKNNQQQPVTADMRAVLLDGLYSLEYHCSDDDKSAQQLTPTRESAQLRDGSNEMDCRIEYQKISMASAESRDLSIQEFMLEGSGFIERQALDSEQEQVVLLKNDTWTLVSEYSTDQWSAQALEGNALTMENTHGQQISVQALQSDISQQSVLLSADPKLLFTVLELDKETAKSTVFPASSLRYTLKITNVTEQWHLPVDSGDSIDTCSDANSNCNVLRSSTQERLPITSLSDIISGQQQPQIHLGNGSNSGQYQLSLASDGTLNLKKMENGQATAMTHNGKWRQVTQGGQTVVLLDLPRSLRHKLGSEAGETDFITEYDGFVRQGTHSTAGTSQTETMFNAAAFDLLSRSITTASQAKLNRMLDGN